MIVAAAYSPCFHGRATPIIPPPPPAGEILKNIRHPQRSIHIPEDIIFNGRGHFPGKTRRSSGPAYQAMISGRTTEKIQITFNISSYINLTDLRQK